MIRIIDYGMGNIHSVRKAVEFLGGAVQVSTKASDISAGDKLILPGVGAFGDAMAGLQRSGMISAVKKAVSGGCFFLGICLGMHLLFEQSEESPGVAGLGIFKGTVKRFPSGELKVPHIGWNSLRPAKDSPIMKGVAADSSVYFCHSYYPEADQMVVAATTEYGVSFASVVQDKNVYACQFHPEKSQSVGLKILKNFVELK